MRTLKRATQSKDRPATTLHGELAEAFADVKRRTGMSESELLRQGVIRIVQEVKANGSLSYAALPE